jgi:hypothetical protein
MDLAKGKTLTLCNLAIFIILLLLLLHILGYVEIHVKSKEGMSNSTKSWLVPVGIVIGILLLAGFISM